MGFFPGGGVKRIGPVTVDRLFEADRGHGGFALLLNRFGDGEQGDAVVDGVQAVAGGGDDEVIAGAPVPAGVGTGQPNPPVQYLQRGLAGAVVIVETGARGQRYQVVSQRCWCPPYTVCALRPLWASCAAARCCRASVVSETLSIVVVPVSQRFEGGVNWRSRLRARPSRRELVGTTTVLKDEAPPASYVNTVVNRSLSSRAW